MGKKHGDKKKKAKVVLSLAEFNEDAGLGGQDPELSALPSAPKAAEEWEALGGRPEYNSRGYKERQPRNYDNDVDFDDRDWTRKGPLDAPEGNGFGMGAERDWGDMRRGPLDAPDGQPERDWNGMRRGPVESAFEGGPERDWGARRGPVEAELGAARVIDDDSWGTRKGPIDAEFSNTGADRDWGVRKGPVEADVPASAQNADWSARKGPVEAEFANAEDAERDWSQRKGPVDANPASGRQIESNWSDVRKGPVEAEVPKPEAERDWSRRGPIEAEVDTVQKAVRDVNFGDMRRGSKLEELKAVEETKEKAKAAEVARPGMDKDRWRRDSVGIVPRRGPIEARPIERPASTGHDSVPAKERDWGAARQTQGIRANLRGSRSSNFGNAEANEASDATSPESAEVLTTPTSSKGADDADWTTVRSATQKRGVTAQTRRFPGRDSRGGFQRRGLQGTADSRGEKPMRSPLNSEHKATTSPLTPVASAVSES